MAVPEHELPPRCQLLFSQQHDLPLRPVEELPRQTRASSSQLFVPRPQPLDQPILRLRVTDFRLYLASEYEFYLRSHLQLQEASDDHDELAPLGFGNLAHEVLRRFGASEHRDAEDAEQIAQLLSQQLDQVAHLYLAEKRSAAVHVQIEQFAPTATAVRLLPG